MHAMWSRLFWPAVALVMVSVAALLFRHALFVAVRRWSGHRTTEDSLFLHAIRVPSMLWCIVLGLFVAIPAVWIYNYLTSRIEYFNVEMDNSSSELVDFFIRKTA